VVASGREAAQIRAFARDSLLIVTPGIRPDGYPEDDQKRTATPRDSILAGADYLVVGRPITDQADPRAAAMAIIGEMQKAFDSL
jgi:orotidine-5'-phosphate decarboxylase